MLTTFSVSSSGASKHAALGLTITRTDWLETALRKWRSIVHLVKVSALYRSIWWHLGRSLGPSQTYERNECSLCIIWCCYRTYLCAESCWCCLLPAALGSVSSGTGGEEIFLLSDTSALLRPKSCTGVSVGQVGEAGGVGDAEGVGGWLLPGRHWKCVFVVIACTRESIGLRMWAGNTTPQHKCSLE